MSKPRSLPVTAIWMGLGLCAACMPSTRSALQNAQPDPVAPVPPVEAELRAAPPPSPVAAARPAGIAPPVANPPSPRAARDEPLACVKPPDPELDRETPWSRELGERLERALPRLRQCTLQLGPDDAASITLRLVYAKDGSPLSQHVVTSTANACPASECLERELAKVTAPTLLIDKSSFDLTLALARGSVPERTLERIDPLTPEAAAVSSDGCVDPAIARLSQTAVRDIVSTTYDELQGCYGQALSRDHDATGKVTFEFIIGQNGSVAEAWAREATLQDCEAIGCMLTEFRALSFPEPVGRSVRVIYPISYVLEQQPVSLR